MEDVRQIVVAVALGVVFVIVLLSLRIAKEHQRFAIFMLGRFFVVRGPGLVISLPFIQKAVRLAIGDKGRYKGDDIAEFAGYGLPVRAVGTVGINTAIRIISFNNGQVHVQPA